MKIVTDRLGTTVNTAAALINDLIAYGILAEMTGRQRNRLFVFREYLDLFR
ncbi:hypothetical protein NUH86_21450 [Sphingobium sp. JS3065]|uniref:hypothetical protein n=1 Tax=Sphingobium sp. JS3065 TaxID=2970925 RepID=UPI002264A3FA|nr:hypothetical protein [Sphingobium sp. JS3065]UZW57286.1 hypothetical protein NUH86_21450 [Sphingobium sp. JS3065]